LILVVAIAPTTLLLGAFGDAFILNKRRKLGEIACVDNGSG
jgi:hypothetical protein